MTDEETVRLSDSVGLGYCVAGQREFFQAHGLPWRAYCRSGMPARLLLETGDLQARQIVENARRIRGTET